MGTAALSVVSSVFVLSAHHHDCSYSPPKWLLRLVKANLWKACTTHLRSRRDSTQSVYENGHLPSSTSGRINRIQSIRELEKKENRNGRVTEEFSVIKNERVADGQDRISYTENTSPYSDIVSNLSHIVSKYDEKESKGKIHAEWKLVAKAFDRLLFKVVSTMLVLMATVILGFIPMTKTWPVLNIAY